MSAGGSILEITIDGRVFPVAADADSNRDLGGFTAEQESNGDGSARKVLTRKPWSLDGIAVEVDDDRGDQEFLQDVEDSTDNVPITITYVTGITYSGLGSVTGDFTKSSMNATAGLTMKGPDKLVKQ